MDNLSLIAGMVASFIFASSYVPMLWKAFQTRDLHSYSWLNLVLVNAGNLIYWLYIATLPPGPIWLLHTFYTVASALLLLMYWRLGAAKPTGAKSKRGGAGLPRQNGRRELAIRQYLAELINSVRPGGTFIIGPSPRSAGSLPGRRRLAAYCPAGALDS